MEHFHITPLSRVKEGVTCKYGHQFSDGTSPRLTNNSRCLVCTHISKWKNLTTSFIKQTAQQEIYDTIYTEHPFNKDVYQLGKLCPHNHSYYGHPYSLRTKCSQTCLDCMRRAGKNYSKSFAGQVKIKCYKSSHKYKKQQRQYKRSDKGKAVDKAWRNTEKCKAYQQVYQIRRRANKLSVKTTPYTAADLATHFDKFKNCCAYCGDVSSPLTIDHFIPLTRGGSDALLNIVPACKSCNCSKNASHPVKWYRSRPYFSNARLKFLTSILLACGRGQSTS